MAHDAASRMRARLKIAATRREWFETHGPCQQCGSWDSLELRYLDTSQKRTQTIWSWSPEERARELSKTIVTCHDCGVALDGARYSPIKHGTITAYRYGCRCNECKMAQRLQRRHQRAQKTVMTGKSR